MALLWMRTGPYHLARARGAAQVLTRLGASVDVVEVSARDHYAWSRATEPTGVSLATLEQDCAYDQLHGWDVSRRLARWLDGKRIDVVACNGWSAHEARGALSWAGKSASRHAVVMSETKADESRRVFWKEWVKRRILRHASAGLVGGELQKDYMASLGVPRENIFLGYNAVDNEYFERGATAARDACAAGADLGPLEGRPYFFAVARFISRKNLDGLLRAYAAYYRAKGSRAWHLVISGSGSEEAPLRELCADLGLQNLVHWPGFLQYPELPRWYAHAGAFIHPAKSEPWGLVVNEAAACSLPLLVAAPVGSRYELLEDGVSGWVFDPFSDVDITRVLMEISAASSADRIAMGEAARRRVADFGPQRFGEGLLAAVRATLGISARR